MRNKKRGRALDICNPKIARPTHPWPRGNNQTALFITRGVISPANFRNARWSVSCHDEVAPPHVIFVTLPGRPRATRETRKRSARCRLGSSRFAYFYLKVETDLWPTFAAPRHSGAENSRDVTFTRVITNRLLGYFS